MRIACHIYTDPHDKKTVLEVKTMKRKTFGKAGAAVLTMAMLLSMGAMAAPVSAAGTALEDGTKIEVQAKQGTFKLFKVAEATKNAQTGAVTYTVMNAYSDVLTTASGFIVSKNAIASASIAAGDKLDAMIDHGTKIEAIAGLLETKARAGAPVAASVKVTNNKAELPVTEAGYYLIIGDSVAKTQPILINVLPDANIPAIKVKNSDIPFIKKISAITNAHSTDDLIGTDSQGNEGGTGISEEGGLVEYTLSTVVPKYDSDVTALADDFMITDVPEDSIVIDMNSITVYVADEEVEAGDETFTVTKDKKLADFKATGKGVDKDKKFVDTVNADGTGFQVVFDDDFVLTNGGKTVDVIFKATVTNADIDEYSNDNGATLSYSNNYFTGKGSVTYTENPPTPDPENPDNPPEEHPDDGTPTVDEDHPKVIPDDAFIYCSVVTVNKVNPNQEALPGAVFELKDGNGRVVATVGSGDEDSEDYKSTFVFKGLGDGTYTLHEKSAPAGYNTANDVQFTITSNKKANTEQYIGTFTKTGTDDGVIKVEDPPKQTLPGTGGIGDYVFMIGGAALIVLACVLFVVYMKRRKTEE